jgi:cyclase
MRLIARLDVKNDHVIKGIHLEGLRRVGEPNEMARAYYQAGAHEILFMDAVASLYDRNGLFHVIERAVRDVFVPITVGGGLRSLDDVSAMLNAGADKVAVNTAAVRDITIVSRMAERFGRQCIVGSIEAKRNEVGGWGVYIDNGREPTGLDVIDWAKRLEAAGVGEILVTSVDQEGTRRGFDVPLAVALQGTVRCPIVVSGGYGKPAHLDALLDRVMPSAVACAAVLHYGQEPVGDIKAHIAARTRGQSHG